VPLLAERMHPFEMTRALIDMESITENEKQVGEYLLHYLSGLAAGSDGRAEAMPVSPERFNVYAEWGRPVVALSTHMDTVPPFIESREDDDHIYGRGACDAKGIIAAMIASAESCSRRARAILRCSSSSEKSEQRRRARSLPLAAWLALSD